MKIKSKIIVFFTVWLVFILLIVNLIVYALFIQMATKNERERLLKNANEILFSVATAALLSPGNELLLSAHLTGNMMLRVIQASGHVVNEAVAGRYSHPLPPKTAVSREDELLKINGQYELILRLPIYSNDISVGTLEMAETFDTLHENIRILMTVLIAADVGAVLLSLAGATFVSNSILNPISRLIRAMEEVENSLAFKQLPHTIRPKDEIYKMTCAFNRMIGRIEESFMKQRQFVSDASHELKTPLTIIESYASILRRWGMTDQEVQKEAVEAIYEESIRMKRLAQQLLDLDRHEAGDELQMSPVELVALSRQAARAIAKVHKREIRVEPSDPEVTVTADKMKIRQLLLILLDNARKYSEERIDIFVKDLQDTVEIRVRDYGIGIPGDELDQIFERFYRVDKARQRVTGGTGLGLSIAQSIVERHGGEIRVESEEGKGTEAVVVLSKGGASPDDVL